MTNAKDLVALSPKVKNPVLNAGQLKFIHDNCEVSDPYNYNNVEPESAAKTVFRNKVSKPEVEVLMGTEAEKCQIEALANELKSLDYSRLKSEVNITLGLARIWYQTGKGGFYHTKKSLVNAIKTIKADEQMRLALTKLINA